MQTRVYGVDFGHSSRSVNPLLQIVALANQNSVLPAVVRQAAQVGVSEHTEKSLDGAARQ